MENQIITDPKKQRWVILSVCFSLFMVCLDSYIVNISLPTISHYFNVSTSLASRIIQVYLLILTSTLLVFGKLGDRFGLKRMFLTGYVIFIIGSLLCGISTTIDMLVAARCVQGLGGSILYAVGPATIPKCLPGDMRGAAFGKVSMGATLGLTLGAPLGGVITAHFSWQWIFLINVPVGIVAIFVANRALPSVGRPVQTDGKTQVDFPGVILSFTSVFALLYTLNVGRYVGWESPSILLGFAVAAMAFGGFLWWEQRCRDPVLDLKLFKNRNFTLANFSNLLVFGAMAGNAFLLPFYLVVVKQLRSDQAGFVFMVLSVVMMMVGPVAGKLSDRIRPERICRVSMLLAGGALLFFYFILPQPGLGFVLIYLVWFAVSLGSFIPPNNNLVMGSAPMDKQGSASAVLKALSNLGMALGVCIYAAIFSGATGLSSASLTHANVLPERLFHGFCNAYLVGAGACLVGMLLLLGVHSGNTPAAAGKGNQGTIIS